MGQSTDAYAAFGFDMGEDVEWPAGLADVDDAGDPETWPDLDGWIARRQDVTEPTVERYQDPEWGDFFRAKSDAVMAFPVDLVSHCSGDRPMWVFALRRTVQRATRGSPADLTVSPVTDAEIAAMRDLCSEMGLEWQEPKWLLFSDWS